MNNIHEKDWAEESWSGHTGMNSVSDYCLETDQQAEVTQGEPEVVTDMNDLTGQ